MQVEFLGKNKKGGRPPFKPTQPVRNRVEIAAGAGISAAEVAAVLGISRATLEQHFADELRHGRVKRHIENLVRLDRAAQRGSVSACKALLMVFSDGAIYVGKKERQQRAAEAAMHSSEWGDLLDPQRTVSAGEDWDDDLDLEGSNGHGQG